MAQNNPTRELYEAATKGDLPAVKRLVESGKADVNAYSQVGLIETEWVSKKYIYGYNISNKTPLFSAAFKGNKEVVNYLLSRGVNLAIGDHVEWNALHGASSKGISELIPILVKGGINVNSLSYFGDTPLHIAAYFGRSSCIEELVKLGADKSLKNSKGQTPFEVAESRGHPPKFLQNLKL